MYCEYLKMKEKEWKRTVGFCVDEAFYIYDDGDKIGVAAISISEPCTIMHVPEHDSSTIFLEWINIYKPFQKKGYLAKVLPDIAEKYSVKNLMFVCRPEETNMYQHLGAVIVEYDKDRNMYAMNLMISDTKKSACLKQETAI